jgi:putative sigma-54 modulation protein
MRIDIRASADWPDASVALARTRLEFTLGRFAGRVRSLTVRLTDANGPRGRPDKKCLIAVRLTRPRQVVVVEDVDTDCNVVVSRAAERTSRAVSRAVQSARDWRIVQGGY